MSRDRFNFIWRHSHVQSDNENYQEDLSESKDGYSKDEEEDFVEQTMDWVQAEEEEQNMDEFSVDMSDGDANDVEGGEQEKNDKEGTCLFLDEMMMPFQGQSSETHCMKNKPISEGYKFFTLTTTNGFVVNFTPDGRTTAKTGKQEYSGHSTGGKIESMVSFITSIVDRFQDKQKERLDKLATRASNMERE
eukprot:13071207-Ditylum_brightwellii.AAC.1